MPTMDEAEVFPIVAATVAMEAIKNGVARKILSYQQAYQWAKKDITYARELTNSMIKNDFILLPPEEMINEALEFTIGMMNKKDY
jgi:malate dehydrogenase (oxaloacetate-decarboxylating)